MLLILRVMRTPPIWGGEVGMTDCDRVREAAGVKTVCCQRCHVTNSLSPISMGDLGLVEVCCTLTGQALMRDRANLPVDAPWRLDHEE